MTATQPTPLNELPEEALCQFASFQHLLPASVTRRWIESASAQGRFPPGVRLTPRSQLLYKVEQVRDFFALNIQPIGPEGEARFPGRGLAVKYPVAVPAWTGAPKSPEQQAAALDAGSTEIADFDPNRCISGEDLKALLKPLTTEAAQ